MASARDTASSISKTQKMPEQRKNHWQKMEFRFSLRRNKKRIRRTFTSRTCQSGSLTNPSATCSNLMERLSPPESSDIPDLPEQTKAAQRASASPECTAKNSAKKSSASSTDTRSPTRRIRPNLRGSHSLSNSPTVARKRRRTTS